MTTDNDEFPICQMDQLQPSHGLCPPNPHSSNRRHCLHSWHENTHFLSPQPPPLNVRPLFSSLVLEFFFTLQSLSWRKKSETSLCILFLLLKRNGGRGMIHVLYSVLFRIEASVSGERPALKALYLKHLFWNSSFLFRDAHGFDICRLATMEGQ